MLEKIEEKLKIVNQQIEQSIANHNALIGAKSVLEQMYKEFKNVEPVSEEMLKVVDPHRENEIESVPNAIE